MSSPSSLSYSHQANPLTLREVLEAPNFEGTEVLAGTTGLDRAVSSVNVMENPDIVPWVKQGELLITVGYSLLGRSTDIAPLIARLDDRGLAGFGVKLGPYITEIDAEALAVADQRGFPVLALPPTASFDDLIADVFGARGSTLLGSVHLTSDIAQELMNVALAGGSPADVAEQLAHLAGCEVYALGLGHEVLAHRLADGQDPPARDPGKRSQFREAISAPIVFGSTYVGQLHVFSGDGATAESLSGLVATCAQIMALAASREIAVASVDRQFRSEFLEQVLRNRLDRAEIDRRCQALEWKVRFPAVVVTLSSAALDAVPHLERIQEMFDWALRGRGIHAPHAIVNGDIVAIVSSRDDPEAIAFEAATNVMTRSPRGMWFAGVSGLVDEPAGLQRGWGQARMASKVARTAKGEGEPGRFKDLGVYRLLSEVEPALLQDFAREALGELYDPEVGRGELRHTLAVLLETNLNVAETARQLHYHYNSVRYRTAQLEKMLGPFLSDSTRRLELHVALLICDMVTERGDG